MDAAEKWFGDWRLDEGLVRLAYDKCVEKTGRFQHKYMDKILESWHLDGIDTAEKAQARAAGRPAAGGLLHGSGRLRGYGAQLCAGV